MNPPKLLIGLWLAVFPSLVFAQGYGGEQMTLKPPLAEVFPMANTPQGVQMTAPVMFGINAIIPSQAIIRVCYERPEVNDSAANEVHTEAKGLNTALARQNDPLNSSVLVSPQIEAAIKMATKTVWPDMANFQHAFQLMDIADMRIVYMDPASQTLQDVIMNLPEGLLLSEKEGKVMVLSVENNRSGETAGILSGDQLLEVGGKKLAGTLVDFAANYRDAQTAATTAGSRKIIVLIQRKGEPAPREVTITHPPTIQTGLLYQ